jgi:hypothetical protein
MPATCDSADLGGQSEVWAVLKQPMLTAKEFKVVRGQCVCRCASPELAQLWIARAIVREDEVSRWYWVSDFPVEQDIMECLEVIKGGPIADQHHATLLRHVRRFMLTRYAFDRVCQVNNMLAAHLSSKRPLLSIPSRLWLWKDLFLPRIALSLFIGYAVLLGAGQTADWLCIAASRARSGWFICCILLILTVFVVYLSVRTRIGSMNSRSLFRRTVGVSAGCILWALVAAAMQHVGQHILLQDHARTWPAELLTAQAALFIALLTQFFFGKSGSGSISEPL